MINIYIYIYNTHTHIYIYTSPGKLVYFAKCGFCSYGTVGIPMGTNGTWMDLGKSAKPKQFGMRLDTIALQWNRLPNSTAVEVFGVV